MIAFARGADRRRDDLYTLAGEDRVEHAGERRVLVADQEFEQRDKVTEVHQRIACLLADPVRGRCLDGIKDPCWWVCALDASCEDASGPGSVSRRGGLTRS